MPQSSEQVLQPSRYAGDPPRVVRFDPADSALFENTMGDLGIRILTANLNGSREIAAALNIGWGGDRFRVYDVAPAGALVWYIVWDNEAAAARFQRTTGRLADSPDRAIGSTWRMSSWTEPPRRESLLGRLGGVDGIVSRLRELWLVPRHRESATASTRMHAETARIYADKQQLSCLIRVIQCFFRVHPR